MILFGLSPVALYRIVLRSYFYSGMFYILELSSTYK